MIQRNPRDVIAYHNRDIDRAISDCTKAIALNPNYAPAYYSRARAYTRKGDYVRAVDECDEGRRTHAQDTAAGPAQTKGSC